MKYEVKANLTHNGKRYQVGDIADIADKYAKPLLKDGVIAKIKATKKETKKDEVKEEITGEEETQATPKEENK